MMVGSRANSIIAIGMAWADLQGTLYSYGWVGGGAESLAFGIDAGVGGLAVKPVMRVGGVGTSIAFGIVFGISRMEGNSLFAR